MLKLLYFLAFLIKAVFLWEGGKDGNTLQISSHHTNSSYLYPFEVVLRKMFSNDPFTPPAPPPPSHFKHSPRPSRRLTITMTSDHDHSSFRRLTITTTHHYDDFPFRRLTITTTHHFDDLPSRRITISTTYHHDESPFRRPSITKERLCQCLDMKERLCQCPDMKERQSRLPITTTSHYDGDLLISTTSHYDDLPFRRPSITTKHF